MKNFSHIFDGCPEFNPKIRPKPENEELEIIIEKLYNTIDGVNFRYLIKNPLSDLPSIYESVSKLKNILIKRIEMNLSTCDEKLARQLLKYLECIYYRILL